MAAKTKKGMYGKSGATKETASAVLTEATRRAAPKKTDKPKQKGKKGKSTSVY